jgi:hypothetical protein
MKTKSIKTTLTVCVVSTLAWLGATPAADARPPVYYGPSASYMYVDDHCYSGPSVHTERYLIGYDCHGRAIWGYRQVRRYNPPPVRPSYCAPVPYRPYPYHHSYRGHGRSYGGYCR